jgi:hypothetical protein
MVKIISSILVLSFILSGFSLSSISATGATHRPMPPDRSVLTLAQTLTELSNPYTLVYFAQSPLDIDFTALAYCRYKYAARSIIVFATRGELSADTPGNLSNEARGVLNTQKALRIAHQFGADTYFLNIPDCGYVQTAEEALSVWGKDEALKKTVQAIRILKPDVIITSHQINAGDGRQQATARLLLEAYDAAADEKFSTPNETQVWQSRRVFQLTDETNFDVLANLNEFDPWRGTTYGESVKPFSPTKAPKVADKLYFKILRSASGERPKPNGSLFEGLSLPAKIQQSLAPPLYNGKPLTEALALRETLVQILSEKLAEKRAEGGTEALRERYGADFFRMIRFIEMIERAISLAAGIRLELTVEDPIVAQGERVAFNLTLYNGSPHPVAMVFHSPETLPQTGKPVSYKTTEVLSVGANQFLTQAFSYEITKETVPTLPPANHLYDENFYPTAFFDIRHPFGNPLFGFAEVNLGQMNIRLTAIERFDIVEPIEMSASPAAAFVRDWSQPRNVELALKIRNRTRQPVAATLWIVPLALSSDTYQPLPITLNKEDEETTVNLTLQLPILKPPLSSDVLLELRRPKPAPPDPIGTLTIPVKRFVCQVADNLKVAYIGSPDSSLPVALNYLGVENERLSIDQLAGSDHGNKGNGAVNQLCVGLSRFDTIIVDAMVYANEFDLMLKNRCLLEYVKRGGNLVVFYQKPGFWNSNFNVLPLAPFPLTLSTEHISNENSTITIRNPEHHLLSKPNKISERDFANWLVTRARFVPKSWASDYTPLLESSDTSDETKLGSLLVARYENGFYIYTSLDLSAQFQSFHAGAYRLLANLISLPKVAKEPGSK